MIVIMLTSSTEPTRLQRTSFEYPSFGNLAQLGDQSRIQLEEPRDSFSTSSGDNGSMSNWDFFASAISSGSFMVSMRPFAMFLRGPSVCPVSTSTA